MLSKMARNILERVLRQRSAAIRELLREPVQASPAGPGPSETAGPSIGPPAVDLADAHRAKGPLQ